MCGRRLNDCRFHRGRADELTTFDID